ncbi:MAG: hypothetical protein V2A66_04035 [Pseudomonadota bacterium]
MRSRLGKSGFSIIEAILAVVIISSCFLALMLVISNTTIGNIRLDVSTTSVMLARGKLAEVMANDFDSIANVVTTPFTGNFSGYSYSVTVNYADSTDPDSIAAGTTDFKKVDVSVTYTGLAGAVHVYDLKVNL